MFSHSETLTVLSVKIQPTLIEPALDAYCFVSRRRSKVVTSFVAFASDLSDTKAKRQVQLLLFHALKSCNSVPSGVYRKILGIKFSRIILTSVSEKVIFRNKIPKPAFTIPGLVSNETGFLKKRKEIKL